MEQRECRECGTAFKPRQYNALFCGAPCRMKFNRRRRDRGAELYDVVMTENFDKGLLKNLTEAYRVADRKLRGGRPSWQPWSYASLRIPISFGEDGDNR